MPHRTALWHHVLVSLWTLSRHLGAPCILQLLDALRFMPLCFLGSERVGEREEDRKKGKRERHGWWWDNGGAKANKIQMKEWETDSVKFKWKSERQTVWETDSVRDRVRGREKQIVCERERNREWEYRDITWRFLLRLSRHNKRNYKSCCEN
jgi:hypothetical protein